MLDAAGRRAGHSGARLRCDAGRFLRAAADRGADVAGLDAAAPLVEIAVERVPEADLRVGDLERLPWPDRSFDVVTGLSSFQLADDPRRALDEAGRAFRGLVVAAVPRASRSPTSAGLGPNADDEVDSLTELEDADAAVAPSSAPAPRRSP